MAVKFTNNAATTLAAGINSSVTSISVTDGSVFPALTGSDHFYVTFDDTTNREIVKVTARSGNTLTVVRGQDNTTAQAFNSGDKAELRVVAALLEDITTEVTSTLSVDTFTGDGTTTAFTLSQAPSSEDNLIVFIEGAYQNPGDFVLSGTTLTLDEAPVVDRNIIVYHVKGAVSGNNLNQDSFTADGNTAAFTLSIAPIHENNTQVFIDGVYQQKNSYSVSGTTLTLDANPSNGATVEVMTFTQTDVNTLPASFVSGLTEVTAVGADHFMIFDATDSALKKSLVSDVLESATSISTSADATAITIDSSENVTFTNNVIINSGQLTAGGLAYPTSDGTNGQVLTTNGAGTLSFSTISGYTDSDVATYLGGGNTINIDTQGTIKLDGNYPTGSNNVALGNEALDDGSLSGGNNTAIGSGALTANTSGSLNVAVGTSALSSNTTAPYNTAIGYQALRDNVAGNQNTAVGYEALASNTALKNTAVGAYAQYQSTTAQESTALGYAALAALTTGSYNVAVGASAVDALTTGGNNVGIGYKALSASNGDWNVAIGSEALKTEATSGSNVAIGGLSMQTSNGASNNVAVGKQTGYLLTTGDYNVFVGSNCGFNQTTASRNTAMGYVALYSNETGDNNTAIGQNAGYSITTGNHNTLIGRAGQNITTGRYNVCVGETSGYTLTTGEFNVYMGYLAQASGGSATDEIVIAAGNNFIVGKGNNTGFISPDGGGVYQGNNSSSWSTTSDRRIKKNIEDNNIGLNAINQIQVKNFEYRTEDEIVDFENPAAAVVKKEGIHLGVIAQEIEEILPDMVVTESTGVKSVNPNNLTWYLVNAVKELSAEVEELKSRLGD